MAEELQNIIVSVLGAVWILSIIVLVVVFCVLLWLYSNKREDQRQKYLRDLPEDERKIITKMFDNDLTFHKYLKSLRKKKKDDKLNEN